MHILLIHQAFVTPNEPGGTRHYEFLRHMVKKGHRATVVTSNLSYLTGKSAGSSGRLFKEENQDGIRIIRVYTIPTLHRSFVWRVFSFIGFMLLSAIAAFRVRRVDLVMGTSPPIFQAVSALLTSLSHRAPFLLEIRDLWPEFAIDMGVLKNSILIILSRWLEKALYRFSDMILVNSPAYRQYLLDYGVLPKKVSFIPNGVDTDLFDPSQNGENFRKKFQLDGKFVVTYSGALGLANDLETLLKAAKYLNDRNDIRFFLIGDGKERSRLEKIACEMSLKNVTFTGTRPKEEIPEILCASDACLAILKNITMFKTTYPNKVFDYMAAGRPTIFAIDGVIRRVLEDSNGGIFVPPGDPKSLAEAVEHMADHKQEAESMGKSARAYVSKNFNRHNHSVDFLNLTVQLYEPF
jgi:glycosyltransferase involved in cell wall biosynthesis